MKSENTNNGNTKQHLYRKEVGIYHALFSVYLLILQGLRVRHLLGIGENTCIHSNYLYACNRSAAVYVYVRAYVMVGMPYLVHIHFITKDPEGVAPF